MIKYNNLLTYMSFAVYIILLIWVVIFKWTNYISVEESIITFRKLNLVERFYACKQSFFGFDFLDIMLNVILFIPLGLFFKLMFRRKYLVILMGGIFSFIFEISQFLTCIGMFNMFDIIANTTGCVLGYVLFVFFEKIINKRFVNIVNIAVIIVGVPLCIYAIVMTIINFHYYL